MKRTESESIGDILRRTIQEANLKDTLDEGKAADLWPVLMGPHIASRTTRPRVSAGVMVIYVDSASLRNELNMNRTAMIKAINEHLGREVIKEIRFK